MPSKYRIDYLEFPSTDSAASRRFLETAFGWSGVDYGPSYNGIEGAGIDVGIDGDSGRTAAPLVIVRTDDLERARRDVEAAGGTVTRPAFDFPGGRRFHFREPGGSELAVWVATE